MKMIVAADKKWGIGRDNKLLVSIPADMKSFRAATTGQVIVMGRKTLESFPGGKPLKNRVNLVLTGDRNYRAEGATVLHSVEEVLEELKNYPDKEAGLIVDYIGMAAELKIALAQYTHRDQNKVPDLKVAYTVCMAKLEVMRDMFYGHSYSEFFGDSETKRLKAIADGVEFALTFTEEESKNFIKEATALSQAETLVRSMLNTHDKREIEFFK